MCMVDQADHRGAHRGDGGSERQMAKLPADDRRLPALADRADVVDPPAAIGRPPSDASRPPEGIELRLQLGVDAVEQLPDMLVVLL